MNVNMVHARGDVMLLAGETVINPLVGNIKEFNEAVPVMFKENNNYFSR